jgi:hypothetical protein
MITNIFDNLEFGSFNPHKIHLATPGECLHMHQLGVTKRALESFEDFVMGRIMASTNRFGHRQQALDSIAELGKNYGALLSRQSDRDFPCPKFTTTLISPNKKEGNDYAGILLCLIMALMSDKGKKELQQKAQIPENHPSTIISKRLSSLLEWSSSSSMASLKNQNRFVSKK